VTLFVMRTQVEAGGTPGFASLFLGAVILWNLFFRCQQDISVSFLDDVWARSLITLFGSPLSVGEFLSAMMLLGLVKLVITIVFMALMAFAFYSFNLFAIGLALLPFVANLILLGWSVGLVAVAIIMRYGTKVAILWSLPVLLQPVSSVFYPETVLPGWLRAIAQLVPPTTSSRACAACCCGTFAWDRFAWAVGTSVVYLIAASAIFVSAFRSAHRNGLLTKTALTLNSGQRFPRQGGNKREVPLREHWTLIRR
jgi:ABC-2 type transport system permease protein